MAKNPTMEEVRYCYDFVIESALTGLALGPAEQIRHEPLEADRGRLIGEDSLDKARIDVHQWRRSG
jgi:hypothetical protein